jgi:hypothetical protein
VPTLQNAFYDDGGPPDYERELKQNEVVVLEDRGRRPKVEKTDDLLCTKTEMR